MIFRKNYRFHKKNRKNNTFQSKGYTQGVTLKGLLSEGLRGVFVKVTPLHLKTPTYIGDKNMCVLYLVFYIGKGGVTGVTLCGRRSKCVNHKE